MRHVKFLGLFSLTPYSCSYTYVDHPHHSVIEPMTNAMELFPNAVAILSNSAGSSDDEGYAIAKTTEQKFNLPVIRHTVKKPGCLSEASYFQYANPSCFVMFVPTAGHRTFRITNQTENSPTANLRHRYILLLDLIQHLIPIINHPLLFIIL